MQLSEQIWSNLKKKLLGTQFTHRWDKIWMNVAERLLGVTITPDWEDTITTPLQSDQNRLDTVLL
ncbi:unnamed protein product [Brassica oleracea var. botrytis]|uniref:(rape) hypothetical protein n=1 Tax=Brassica napus TaxID=3708 RepID=A0A816JVM2_BRANA|nr:unnamed protein product [Brassica napus]